MRSRSLYAVGAIVLLVGLAACSSGADDDMSSDGSAVGADAGRAPLAQDSGSSSSSQGAALTTLTAPHMQVVTGAITVQTASVLTAARRVAAIATGAGGIVTDEQTDTGLTGGGGDADEVDRSAGTLSTLTVRVPPDAYDDTVAAIAALGTLVTQSRTTTDVTDEYVDVQARVTSQEASLQRLLALVGSAAELDDVIALEDDIASRQADLDSLKARMAALDQQVDLATIAVTLTEDGDVVAAASRSGFVGGLDRGWDSFTAAVGFTLAAIGVLLPFVVLFGLLALAARPLVRRYRRRTAPTPASPAPSQ